MMMESGTREIKDSPGMLERIKKNSLVQGWLVLLLALFFGSALASVQLSLGPKIEMNKLNETLSKVPELVLGASLAHEMEAKNQELGIEAMTIGVDKNNKRVSYNVYKTTYNEEITGWVAKTSGQGYAGNIELLLGLDPEMESITGLFILDQKETPGLGNKIITEKWRKQFINKPTKNRLIVVKDGADALNEIDAITGATISSRSVSNIMNTAISDLKGQLISGQSSNR
jgi:electron transport complex protein RnfG